jgi:hypothetical protein
MPYGIRTFTAGGATLLDFDKRTARIVDVQTVTVPAVGSTNTYTLPAGCTPTTCGCILDNGGYAFCSSSTVATVPGSQGTGSTTMTTYRYA